MKKLRTLAVLIAALCYSVASAYDFEVDGIYCNITSETDLAVTYKRNSSVSYENECTEKCNPRKRDLQWQ